MKNFTRTIKTLNIKFGRMKGTEIEILGTMKFDEHASYPEIIEKAKTNFDVDFPIILSQENETKLYACSVDEFLAIAHEVAK